MDAHQTSTDVPACPGCAERDRRIGRLEAQVQAIQQQLEALTRSARRQATHFSRLPKVDPKPPGRKGGDDSTAAQSRINWQALIAGLPA